MFKCTSMLLPLNGGQERKILAMSFLEGSFMFVIWPLYSLDSKS